MLRTAKLLVEKGADVSALCDHEFTAAHIAAHVGNGQLAAFLVQQQQEGKSRKGHTPQVNVGFWTPPPSRHLGGAKMGGGGGGCFQEITPLHLAARAGHVAAVADLALAHADINAEDSNGYRSAPAVALCS